VKLKQTKMKAILKILLIFININLIAQKIENHSYNNNYFYKDRILYLCIDSAEYSGKFIEYYPGEPKMTGAFKNGLKNGPFIYYDSENTIIREENYREGKRHGLFKEYYKLNAITQNLISKEVFSNDSLISGYYWHSSGQILKTIINRDTTYFELDTSIFTIVPHIKGLHIDYRLKYSLSKKDLCNYIDSLISIICLGFNGHEEDTGYDTIQRADFKIKSYYIGGPIYSDRAGGDHIDWDSGLVVENDLSNKNKNRLCDYHPAFLCFSRIVILDKYNIEYEMNDMRINIKE